jgi:prevent-host-death family protein
MEDSLMRRVVTAIAARNRLGELLEGVYHRGDEIVIERANKPMAVLVPLEAYEQIERRRAEARRRLEEVWAAMPSGASVAEVEALIEQEIDAARAEAAAQRT